MFKLHEQRQGIYIQDRKLLQCNLQWSFLLWSSTCFKNYEELLCSWKTVGMWQSCCMYVHISRGFCCFIVQWASSGLKFNHRIVQKECWCIICHSRCLFGAKVEEGTCVPYQLLQNASGSRSTSQLSVHVIICSIIKAFFTIIDRFWVQQLLRDYDLHSNMQLSKQPNLLKLLTNCLIALTSLPFSQGKKKRKPFQQPYRNKPDFDKDPDFWFKVILLFTSQLFYHILLFCVAVSGRSANT